MEIPNFDDLVLLSKENPEKLEQLRKTLAKTLIASAPPCQRDRLETIQYRVDLEISRSDNPIDAMLRLSKMMHEKFDYLKKTVKKTIAKSGATPELQQNTQALYTKTNNVIRPDVWSNRKLEEARH